MSCIFYLEWCIQQIKSLYYPVRYRIMRVLYGFQATIYSKLSLHFHIFISYTISYRLESTQLLLLPLFLQVLIYVLSWRRNMKYHFPYRQSTVSSNNVSFYMYHVTSKNHDSCNMMNLVSKQKFVLSARLLFFTVFVWHVELLTSYSLLI